RADLSRRRRASEPVPHAAAGLRRGPHAGAARAAAVARAGAAGGRRQLVGSDGQFSGGGAVGVSGVAPGHRGGAAGEARSLGGLGNVELEAQDLLTGRDDAGRWRIALALRAALPTATGTYSGAGSGLGLQALAAHPLGARLDVYLGAGAAFDSDDRFDGIAYERVRPQGFLAFEVRVTRGWSAIAQLDAASGLVTNLDGYPGG